MSEKAWNASTGEWEIDGVPITYRVTWKTFEPAGAERSREFSDIDQGHSFYEMMRRDSNSFDATWEHVPY